MARGRAGISAMRETQLPVEREERAARGRFVRGLYTGVLAGGLVALAPVFAFKALRHGKYLGSLRERFGRVRVAAAPGRTLWIHAVSVGETLAAEPLVRAAARRLPGWRVVVSTTTATGQRVAAERFPDLDVFYFPLDLPGAVAAALERVRPDAVCLVETEIWPNFLAGCRRRRVPVAVVNGRLSDGSFRGYRRAGPLLRPVLDGVGLFLMQSEGDAERIRALGARPERVSVAGNLKYDVDREELEARLAPKRRAAEEALGLPDPRPLVVAGSTAPGEEAVLAEALALVRREPGLETTRLLVAPRHPERFDEAAQVFERAGLAVARRSRPAGALEADVLLLDTIGELAALYAHASAVFVGGSIAPRGGHNVIEPALYARPVVVGPHTENFRQIVGDFVSAGAVVQLPREAADGRGGELLGKALIDLLSSPERAAAVGERAFGVLVANRGATERTLEGVARLAGARLEA